MPAIRDSRRDTVADHAIDLRIGGKNLRSLSPDETREHLDMLIRMLEMLRTLLRERLRRDGGGNAELIDFIGRLGKTLWAVLLKHRMEALRRPDDIRLPCTLDTTDSGYPIVIRDFHFLAADQEHAEASLEAIPPDETLVDDALYFLFRGLYPRDPIAGKLARAYYETLQGITPPRRLRFLDEKTTGVEDDHHYVTLSVERLDDHHNLPRFYTLYMRVPERSYPKREWRSELVRAIENGLSTVVNLELGYLARGIEEVTGVKLECIERFDIGPFYNRFTTNPGPLAELLTGPSGGHSGPSGGHTGPPLQCVLAFQKQSVVRTGEKKRRGLGNWIRGFFSGDAHIGELSPPIASPRYLLMPHRLVQRAHDRNLDLDNSRLYGFTATGRIDD